MEKQSKIPMVYGYAVCLVAVITFLIAGANIVNAIIDMGDPLHASRSYGAKSPSLASFENYKMDVIKSLDEKSIPDDVTLRAMYEAAKEDRIQTSRHNSVRSLLVSGLLVVVCVLLFAFHWRWIRKLTPKA